MTFRTSGGNATLDVIPFAPTAGIAVLDYDKDGWMDIAVTHAGAPGLTLWRNVAGPQNVGRRFERVPLPLHGAIARMGRDGGRYRQRWMG